MTGVLLLLYVLSGAGEYNVIVVQFDTVAECEAKRQELTMVLVDPLVGAMNRPAYIAGACVVPVKLRSV